MTAAAHALRALRDRVPNLVGSLEPRPRLASVRRVPAVIVAAILLVACAGPDAAHYSAILDEIVVPDGWTEAATVIHGPGGDVECQPTPISECPYAVRFYTTPAGPIEAYAAARSMVAEAGFALEREFDVACDGQSPACALTAIRDGRSPGGERVPAGTG